MRHFLRAQRGFGLLELVIVVGLSGLLVTGLGSIGFGLLRHTETARARVTATTDIEEVARLVTRDGQTAQATDLVAGATAVNTLTLSWIDPVNGDSHEVAYTLSGQEVIRTKSVNSVVQNVRAAARHVSSLSFSQPVNETRLIKVTLASSGGSPWVAETKEYYVAIRAMD